jgi:hypothetical protein
MPTSFLLKNGIFFGERILDALKKLDGLAWAAIIEHEINVEHDIRPMERKSSNALQNEGEPLLQELQALIRDRLWPKENVGLQPCNPPDLREKPRRPVNSDVRDSIPSYGFLYCQVLVFAYGKYPL